MKWPSFKGREVLKVLIKNGWELKRQSGSHKILYKDGFSPYSFSWSETEEIAPIDMVNIRKHTDLTIKHMREL